MLINITIGFILPWILCIFHLYKKNLKLVVTIGSFSSVVAFVTQEIGRYYGFWIVAPFEWKELSSLPFTLGLYTVTGIYLIYFSNKFKHQFLVILLMTTFTTLLEVIYLSLGRVIYGNGWSVYWTFVSYLIPYLLIFWYYLLLKKISINI